MKPPAFQFYPNDFLGGTMTMSQGEVGAYIMLLICQWSEGSIPDDRQGMEMAARGPVSDKVLGKFPAGDDGKRRNVRLSKVLSEQEQYRKSKVAGGQEGARRRWHNDGSPNGSPIRYPMAHPMANGMANAWQNDSPPPPTPSPTPTPTPPSPTPPTTTHALELVTGVQGESRRKRLPNQRQPETMEEAVEFFLKHGSTEAEGQAFWHCYEANGWVTGKSKAIIRKWQSAAHGWIKRQHEHRNGNSSGSGHNRNQRHPNEWIGTAADNEPDGGWNPPGYVPPVSNATGELGLAPESGGAR